MRISLFSGAKNEEPILWEGTWDEFCAEIGPHRFDIADKESTPAFSPAEYSADCKRRSDGAVLAVHLFAIDLDHSTEERVLELLGQVQDRGLAALVYTTWTHASDPWRVRVVLPLSRPVPGPQWRAFWSRAAGLFGGDLDPKCKNPSRIYFGPYAPAGTEDQNFFFTLDGNPLDVDAVSDLPVLHRVVAPEGEFSLRLEQLEKFAKQLSKKANERQAELGEALLRVCRGETFAQPGQRDSTIFQLAGVLARRFSDCRVESIADHFRPSLSRMAHEAPECPTVEDVAYKLRRARDEVQAELDQREAAHGSRIREAFRNGRSHPYSAEELAALGKDADHRWIIQCAKSYYYRVLATYAGPYPESSALAGAVIELSPAATAGVDLFRLNKTGEITQKNLVQLVREYGTVALKTEIHLAAQVASYDYKTRTIIEAPCPIRPIEPKFHPEIDRWLQLMAGDKYQKLLDWLSFVTRLCDPLVGLLLTGAKGTGKSLLASGVARIWTTTRPTALEEVFSDFNESLVRCPLAFADEQLPKDHRGYSKHAELKLHIQSTTRPLRRKFQPTADVIGAMRTIVAANNDDILATPENLSSNDIEAIVERYLHIETRPEAAAYLEQIDTTDWVSGDEIAEHVLWLVQNHPSKAEGRFLIKVGDDSLGREQLVKSGPRGAVCQWLVGYLLNPGKFDHDSRSQKLVRVHKYQLLANTQALVRCWDHYVQNERCPSTGNLATALIAISHPKRLRLLGANGERVNYRVVILENLYSWAKRTGFTDQEQIDDAIIALSEKSPESEEILDEAAE